jgi:hypothetical protein
MDGQQDVEREDVNTATNALGQHELGAAPSSLQTSLSSLTTPRSTLPTAPTTQQPASQTIPATITKLPLRPAQPIRRRRQVYRSWL